MNRNQYFAISWFFLGLMFLLIFLHTKFFLEPSLIFNSDSLSIYSNIKWAIVSIMIYLCFPLFVLFQILAWLKKKEIKNEEKEDDPILISYVKEKTKLKGNPKTRKELYDLAKTMSKKIEVTNAINEYYKTGKKEVKNIALFYSLVIADNVGLKKKPKSPAHLFKLAKKEGKLKEVAEKYDQLEKGDYDKFVEKLKPKEKN